MQKGCKRKHIKTKIPLHHWICPNCYSREFYYCHDKDYKESCFDLHEDDICRCRNCGYNIPGWLFVRMWKNKNKGKVICPHCNGTGLIDEENENDKSNGRRNKRNNR
jgi:hypothetical protein